MNREQSVSLLLALIIVFLFVLTGIGLAERHLGLALITFLVSVLLIGCGFMLKRRRSS
jgi:hypothetical protein